ncbi:MAG: helix-turn-helix transcriptional regulator [Ruminococcaceae bacterium]|nr:helix-turn-helix transcriptional regulator [Oscillospiraceae bacterium]
MEFNEKLQELRKNKGLTQEELAEALYVSRTAISKWELGRGYPSLESLKEIAKYFSVTIDELLSSDEIMSIAQEDNKQKENHFRSLVFGLLDICVLMFFFLPFFGQKANGVVQEVSLLSLNGIATYLSVAYNIVVIAIITFGIATLAFQNCKKAFWLKNKDKISLILNAAAVLLFIISSQPYAGAFLFVFLIIKAMMLVKW